MPEISFLILTYNSERFVDNILGSIFEKCADKIKKGVYELLILDNDSDDDTREKIKEFIKKYPDLYEIGSRRESKKPIYFKNSQENLGYAKGINEIASFARGKLLVVINPDAQLLEADFENLILEFEKDEKLAIAGLTMKDIAGKDEKTAGRFLNPLTFILYTFGFEELFSLRFAPKKRQKVDYVSGGFLALRNESFQVLKGYDEDYFMYVEDMDICFRAKLKKMEVFYLPYATIRHQGQGSSSRTFAIVNIYKGLNIFYRKHTSPVQSWFVNNLLGLKAIIIIFISSFLGNKDLRETYMEALRTIE